MRNLEEPLGERLLNFFHTPEDLLLALLFASTLALGACLWLVWSELRRLTRDERKSRREASEQIQAQFAGLSEKLNGELALIRRQAEQTERDLEASVRRRLEELHALVESLRVIEARFHARLTATAAEPPAGTMAKEARAGFGVIGRPPKTGGEGPG